MRRYCKLKDYLTSKLKKLNNVHWLPDYVKNKNTRGNVGPEWR